MREAVNGSLQKRPGVNRGTHMFNAMVGTSLSLIALVMWALITATATWHAEEKHCRETLSGIAVKEAASNRVICIRKDAVLRVYE